MGITEPDHVLAFIRVELRLSTLEKVRMEVIVPEAARSHLLVPVPSLNFDCPNITSAEKGSADSWKV